jgi:hypothetical protein
MPKKLMALALLSVTALLSGCAAAALMSAATNPRLESSKAAYMRCLEQHPDDPSQCAALREAYEADMRALHSTTQGLTRDGGRFPQ